MISKNKFKQTEIGKIPTEWEVKRLGNIAKFQYGLGESAEQFGDFVYVRITDINSDGTLNKNNLVYISKEKIKENSFLEKGDVLIARTGATYGKTYLFNEDFRATYGGFLIRVIFDKDKIDNNFFFQFSRSKNYWSQAEGLVSGGAQPQFNANVISELNVPLPPLPEQKAIASILSSLDAKIELNNKMNKTLEEIGQTIFRKWFIDNPEKENWEEGKLGDNILTKIIGSGIDLFDGEKIYIATADIEGSKIINYKTKISYDNRPSRANMKLRENTVWFAKMKESKKSFFVDKIMKFELENMIFSTGFTGLEVNKNALYYIWNFINNDLFEAMKDNLSIGTTMQGVNNELIRKIKLPNPPIEKTKKFNDLVTCIYHRIYRNNLQNKTLSQIRDSLLPKLMSGEIRVPIN